MEYLSFNLDPIFKMKVDQNVRHILQIFGAQMADFKVILCHVDVIFRIQFSTQVGSIPSRRSKRRPLRRTRWMLSGVWGWVLFYPLVIIQKAIENGPVEIVDLPS